MAMIRSISFLVVLVLWCLSSAASQATAAQSEGRVLFIKPVYYGSKVLLANPLTGDVRQIGTLTGKPLDIWISADEETVLFRSAHTMKRLELRSKSGELTLQPVYRIEGEHSAILGNYAYGLAWIERSNRILFSVVDDDCLVLSLDPETGESRAIGEIELLSVWQIEVEQRCNPETLENDIPEEDRFTSARVAADCAEASCEDLTLLEDSKLHHYSAQLGYKSPGGDIGVYAPQNTAYRSLVRMSNSNLTSTTTPMLLERVSDGQITVIDLREFAPLFYSAQISFHGPLVLISEEDSGAHPKVIDLRTGKIIWSPDGYGYFAFWLPKGVGASN